MWQYNALRIRQCLLRLPPAGFHMGRPKNDGDRSGSRSDQIVEIVGNCASPTTLKAEVTSVDSFVEPCRWVLMSFLPPEHEQQFPHQFAIAAHQWQQPAAAAARWGGPEAGRQHHSTQAAGTRGPASLLLLQQPGRHSRERRDFSWTRLTCSSGRSGPLPACSTASRPTHSF